MMAGNETSRVFSPQYLGPACVTEKHTPSATDGCRKRVAGAGERKPSAFPETGGGDYVRGPATDLESSADFEKTVNELGAKFRERHPEKVSTGTGLCLCSSTVPNTPRICLRCVHYNYLGTHILFLNHTARSPLEKERRFLTQAILTAGNFLCNPSSPVPKCSWPHPGQMRLGTQ